MADIRAVIPAFTPDIRCIFGCSLSTDSTPPLRTIPGKVSPLDGPVICHFCAISAGGGGGGGGGEGVVVVVVMVTVAARRGMGWVGWGAVRSVRSGQGRDAGVNCFG